MAKANKKAAPAKEEKKVAKAAKEAAPAKKSKKVLTPEEKAAKRAAMKERLANRPEGQRHNSKQIDVIELENGSKVLNYAAPLRKVGSLVTSVAIDAEGNVVGTAVCVVAGMAPKSKKGHGYLVPKVPGMGKAKGAAEDTDSDSEDDDDDED